LDFGRLFDPDDPSILTRINLQTDFIEESANSFLMPHGPNSATIYVKNVTSRDEFHLHNDFLAYLFNYGFIFIAYLFLIIRILARVSKKSPLKNILVFLFYFSSLFHGYLMTFFISIPLMFVLSLIFNNDENLLIRGKRAALA
jgi:O-antigen ligase